MAFNWLSEVVDTVASIVSSIFNPGNNSSSDNSSSSSSGGGGNSVSSGGGNSGGNSVSSGGGNSGGNSGGGRIGNIGIGLIGSKVNTSENSNNYSGNSSAGYSGISGALGSLVSSDNSSYGSGNSIKSGLQSSDYYNSENGDMNSGGSDYYDSNNSGNYSSSESGNSIKSGLKSTQQQTAAPLQQSQIESVIKPTSNLQTTPEQSVQQQTNTLQQSLLNQSAAEDNSPLKQRTAIPGLDRIFDENAIQRDIRQTIDEVNAQNANTRSVGNLGAEQALTDWAWRNELNRGPEEMLFPDGTVPTPFKASFQNNNSNQSNNSNQNSNVNQSSGNLSTMVDLRNGVTNYDQIYSDYVNSHYGNLYNRYKELGYDDQKAMNTASENAQRMAYERIYDLGYRPDPNKPWEENPYLIKDANNNLALGNYVIGLENAIGNDYYTNPASFDTRLGNMLASGTDLRDDRLFDDLTSELAGNAYLNNNEKAREFVLGSNAPTNYGTTPKITNLGDPENSASWNTALQASMAGQLTKDQILHFYDSKYSDLVIPEETKKWLASDSTHSLQQMFLNMGKNTDRLETATGTADEYRKAYEALLKANPALKLMRDKGILSDDDIQMNFFKKAEISKPKSSVVYSNNGGGGYSGGGGGGGGGYNGGSGKTTGNSYPYSPTASRQTQSRIHNIMKNWTF